LIFTEIGLAVGGPPFISMNENFASPPSASICGRTLAMISPVSRMSAPRGSSDTSTCAYWSP
jgi:hypothetical protein